MIKSKTTINAAIGSSIAILIAYGIRWVFPYDPSHTLLRVSPEFCVNTVK